MLKRSRKDLKAFAEEQASKFQSIIGKPVQVRFANHTLDTVVKEVKLARQADMVNKPDMRYDEEGKQYTPSCLYIDCEGGQLLFVMEDIDACCPTLDGVVMDITNVGKVVFTEWRDT